MAIQQMPDLIIDMDEDATDDDEADLIESLKTHHNVEDARQYSISDQVDLIMGVLEDVLPRGVPDPLKDHAENVLEDMDEGDGGAE